MPMLVQSQFRDYERRYQDQYLSVQLYLVVCSNVKIIFFCFEKIYDGPIVVELARRFIVLLTE